MRSSWPRSIDGLITTSKQCSCHRQRTSALSPRASCVNWLAWVVMSPTSCRQPSLAHLPPLTEANGGVLVANSSKCPITCYPMYHFKELLGRSTHVPADYR